MLPMLSKLLIVSFLCSLLATDLAFAQSSTTATTPQISDEDYAVLKNAVSPFVNSLTKPIYVYNWHRRSSSLQLSRQADDPQEYAALQKMTQKYWEKQQDPNNNDAMYGTGLYAAMNPVLTRSYGMDVYGQQWVLTEMRLRPGFRLIDISQDSQKVPPFPAGFFSKIGCPSDWDSAQAQHILPRLLNAGSYLRFPRCAAAIKKLFKEDLKIDGFFYPYEKVEIEGCSPQRPLNYKGSSWYEDVAMVILDGKMLGADDVKVMNANTVGYDEQRTRIQAMMFLYQAKKYGAPPPKLFNFDNIQGYQSAPGRSVSLPANLRLWQDQDSKPMPEDMKPWMQSHLHRCGEDPIYERAKLDPPKKRSGGGLDFEQEESGDSSNATNAQ